MWKVYVPSCVCVTYIRPHLLEKDTVFAWVAMQKSINVIHEVCQSLDMHVQGH